jgi:hypothetical protein
MECRIDKLSISHSFLALLIDIFVSSRWRDRKARLPKCYELLRVLLLYHTTSAAAERSFSLTNSYVSKQQGRLKDDTLVAQVATQYNYKQQLNETAADTKENENEYRVVWTGVRDLLATQRSFATWRNQPPAQNQRAPTPALTQMFAAAGSQIHQAQLQAQPRQ